MPPSPELVFDPSGDVLLVLSKRKTLQIRRLPEYDIPSSDSSQSDDEIVYDTDYYSKQTNRASKITDSECKVSSRHLALASRVFRAMFDGGFQEGIIPDNHQLRKVPLPEDDAQAMMVLLNIIYGLSREIPRTIDLQQLTAIAVLVDKYELHQVVEVYTDIWFHRLYNPHTIIESRLSDWIFVCWVLGKATEFKSLTQRAILCCGPRFVKNGLPLSSSIAGMFPFCDILNY